MLVDARRKQVQGFWAEIHSLEGILMRQFIEKLNHYRVNILFIVKGFKLADLIDKIEFRAALFGFELSWVSVWLLWLNAFFIK